jgi:hypothetical protein
LFTCLTDFGGYGYDDTGADSGSSGSGESAGAGSFGGAGGYSAFYDEYGYYGVDTIHGYELEGCFIVSCMSRNEMVCNHCEKAKQQAFQALFTLLL